ncbi:unnamed protein product [Dibothriocephalus latus]|uniref:Uncharacterized protein n=1 Tax=Dibothriocephalus latus TaxID=60516 RepID=A0A3P6R6H2_DIBLA|nr:unnamed protein product [Dibothriocephalus latus]
MLSKPGIPASDSWLFEIPEDIDVSVAVRDFAQATQLVAKARRRIDELFEEQQRDSTRQTSAVPNIDTESRLLTPFTLSKLADRIEQRACTLSLVLEDELVRAAEGHGERYFFTALDFLLNIELSDISLEQIALFHP